MRFSTTRSRSLAIAALLAAAPISTAAVRWANDPVAHPAHIHDENAQPSRGSSIFTRLRDSALDAIFGAPEPQIPFQKPAPNKNKETSDSTVSSKLRTRYGGDVVLRFNLSTAEEVAALQEAADVLFLDVWEFTKDWADIRVAKDDLASLLGMLPKSLHDAHSPIMPDLAEAIYNTYPSVPNRLPNILDFQKKHSFNFDVHTGGDNIFFNEYQPMSVIVPWMKLMASMFTSHVNFINIGVSFEGRDIPALRIGVRPTNSQEAPTGRKTIIVNGGSHAREWISTASVNYIAWSLITEYGKSDLITKMVHDFDWVFIPTLNPDGYVYSWDNDRLWRKNRQQTHLRFCKGIDLDRSFGYEWDGTDYQSNPCSESYPGDEPFQAVEAQRLAEWAQAEEANNNVTFVGLLDLHSYSQQVLYPYSYSCDVEPPTLENLEELGIGLAKNIHLESGERYTVQSACEGSVGFESKKGKKEMRKARVESGAGSAIDWFYQEMKVRYSYQLKLRDTGAYGFLLPAENIVPVGREAFAAVKYFADFLQSNKGIERGIFNDEPKEDVERAEERVGEKEEERQFVERPADDETLMEGEARQFLSGNFELRRRRR